MHAFNQPPLCHVILACDSSNLIGGVVRGIYSYSNYLCDIISRDYIGYKDKFFKIRARWRMSVGLCWDSHMTTWAFIHWSGILLPLSDHAVHAVCSRLSLCYSNKSQQFAAFSELRVRPLLPHSEYLLCGEGNWVSWNCVMNHVTVIMPRSIVIFLNYWGLTAWWCQSVMLTWCHVKVRYLVFNLYM